MYSLKAQHQIVTFLADKDSLSARAVHDPVLYGQGWDTLAQPRFWRQVMNLPPDSAVINVAATRSVVDIIPVKSYDRLSSTQKAFFKDSVRSLYCLPGTCQLYITTGKSDFYQHRLVIPGITRAIEIFNQQETNPWFAQAILLIESPGRVRYSNKGAYGSFQLMKSVAISQGLVVNKVVDERENFEKCAAAAARFIRRVCVPETKRILEAQGLVYDENELWCRLLVLHVYHAGAANVAGVLRTIAPKTGGMSLIQQIWQTEYGGFRNSSQNYTQLALASLLELDHIIALECEFVCPE
jgi:hypothetical protein